VAEGGATDPLLRPLTIGGLTLDRRLIMAPMAGLTGSAFRASVRRWGAGLVFSEMISAYGIYYGNQRTLDYFAHDDDERPIGFQLFGADAGVMAAAAGSAVAAGADLVDLNMACPVRKVVKTGAGAALLAEPRRAGAIVAAVVRAVAAAAPQRTVPVTVKLRSGLTAGDDLGRLLAPHLIEAGAAAVCLHPRTAAQLYRGNADHAVTLRLAAELAAPVLASGDLDGRETALKLIEGGAAAVMLARGAVGAPWLFAEVLGAPEPSAAEKLDEVRRFAADVFAERGRRAVGYLRQFWPRFSRHGVFDRHLAQRLMQAREQAELMALLGP
jgi:tRNA-dihydrouridine synthase B